MGGLGSSFLLQPKFGERVPGEVDGVGNVRGWSAYGGDALERLLDRLGFEGAGVVCRDLGFASGVGERESLRRTGSRQDGQICEDRAGKG